MRETQAEFARVERALRGVRVAARIILRSVRTSGVGILREIWLGWYGKETDQEAKKARLTMAARIGVAKRE